MSAVRNLKIAPKLFAAFGVVCLLLAAVVAVGINRLGSSQANLQTLSGSGMASVRTIGQVQVAYLSVRMDLANAALALDARGTQAALEKMAASDAAYDQAWQAYLASSPSTSPAQRDELAGLLSRYRSAREDLIPLVQANDVAGFIALRATTTTPITDEYMTHLTEMAQEETQAAADMAAAGGEDYHRAVLVLLLIGALALLVAAVVATSVARSISRPVARTLTVVQGLAHGRLDQRVHHSARDEVGQLAAAVDATMDNLTGTMRRIAGASTTLAASSEELSAVATQLSSGAVQASSQSQVVSAATEEISA
ncbi:Tar ligand binding domain-containing protein, partial [Kineococcus sp. SYSU DK005]|uniref:Tar ligand binding domain-containing protein n=1 Tax=Kineococcus sp. SYSU DK005 TaxID=3383126 RepID=UPI003D7E8C57